MKRLPLLICGILLSSLAVSGQVQEEVHRVEEALIKRFTAEGDIPTYEEMVKRVGHFEESAMHHLNNQELDGYLVKLMHEFPHLTHWYPVGNSETGQLMRCLVVCKYDEDEKKGIPNFKYVANMHGDETAGRVFLAKLAWVLLHNYGKNEYITRLVNTTRVHFLVSMNPDGYDIALTGTNKGRQNINGIDLNRNFPSRLEGRDTGKIQAETDAVMSWSKATPFVLSANLHGGTNLVNYPWDDHPDTTANSSYNPSPDNELFVRIAYSYARSNSRMWKKGPRCLKSGLDYSGDPQSGITNGAYWYQVSGGMQDWLYVNTNSFDVTIEISCEKNPSIEVLEILWDENKYALLEHIEQVHNAIHGYVIDDYTRSGIQYVNVTMDPSQPEGGKMIRSYYEGQFWRLANIGEHMLVFEHPDYETVRVNISVTKENRSPELTIKMKRVTSRPTVWPRPRPIIPKSSTPKSLVIDPIVYAVAGNRVITVIQTQLSVKKGASFAYVSRNNSLIATETNSATSIWLSLSAIFFIIFAAI